jgi:competence protein ComGC
LDKEDVWADCGANRVILATSNLEEFCMDQSLTIIVVLVVLFLVLVILGLVLYNWHKVTHSINQSLKG